MGYLLQPRRAHLLPALALCAGAVSAWSQAPAKPAAGNYTCIDDKGRRITADRPIPECVNREQHLLNRDGSVRMVLPRTLTAEEKAEHEARERAAADARAAHAHGLVWGGTWVRFPDRPHLERPR